MALTLFTHNNNFTNLKALDQRRFNFSKIKQDIVVKQQWVDDDRGGTDIGFGACVYESSVVLSYYLNNNIEICRDKAFVELGAGCGLVGIVASKLNARRVIITDGDDKSVSLLKENIRANCVPPSKAIGMKCVWGDTEQVASVRRLVAEGFDYIVGSDIVALVYSEHFDSLILTLLELCSEQTKIVIAYKARNHTEEAFFMKIAAHFEIEYVPADQVHPDFKDHNIKIFTLRKKISSS